MNERRGRQSGFSLSEMLVVLAIAGLGIAIAIPLVAEQVRQAKVRGAADQIAVDLKAARMIAVSKRATINVTFATDPVNTYQLPRTDGSLRTMPMPSGVRIVSSTSPISFLPNGSVAAPATTVLEASLTGGVIERWTIDTSLLGVSKTTRARVNS